MTHTAAVIRFPADDAIFARLTERQRLANLAEERAEAVETARYIIDHPCGYSDDQLRTACGFYMTHGNGGVHYLRADQHIYAINRREWQARNCPRPETPADVARRFAHRWPEIVSWGAFVAVVLLKLTGWL